MTRLSRSLVALTAAGALLSLLFVFVVPAAPIRLDDRAWSDLSRRTVSGAYHVHSSRSDGAGDKPAIAQAAARAGLRFLILSDHGDATRPPDPPVYLDGVLCLDAVEISTDDGHYVALDMPRSPYPLGGTGASVVEDVARLGGFGVAAHPDSQKPALRWSDPDAPINGIEWLNSDSQWRDSARGRLWRAGISYFFRPGPALASLFSRPSTLDRWDRLTAVRPVVALAGLDAHGGIGRRAEDGLNSNIPGVPSYLASFTTFSLRVELDRSWSGDAATDARAASRCDPRRPRLHRDRRRRYQRRARFPCRDRSWTDDPDGRSRAAWHVGELRCAGPRARIRAGRAPSQRSSAADNYGGVA